MVFYGRKNYPERSKQWFDSCKAQMAEIEKALGFTLEGYWPDTNVEVSFIHSRADVDLHNRQNWPDYFEWLQTHLEKLDQVFRPQVAAFIEHHGYSLWS